MKTAAIFVLSFLLPLSACRQDRSSPNHSVHPSPVPVEPNRSSPVLVHEAIKDATTPVHVFSLYTMPVAESQVKRRLSTTVFAYLNVRQAAGKDGSGRVRVYVQCADKIVDEDVFPMDWTGSDSKSFRNAVELEADETCDSGFEFRLKALGVDVEVTDVLVSGLVTISKAIPIGS